ncbi:hypothetical protein THAOC_30184 [Thalassiosira oceanica]|uniref:Uncharacterized protein n=1 Tax=Thalassiosira oceanica TaxID=159749 RepID=K0RPC9_THAOC|nr:hypothetical protein THAOC_30184 [Thalassiosira oceanica]|eukprot:EJK50726.1 hypothetical protein THAOC_30184 [Thalassiosira oceanica]
MKIQMLFAVGAFALVHSVVSGHEVPSLRGQVDNVDKLLAETQRCGRGGSCGGVCKRDTPDLGCRHIEGMTKQCVDNEWKCAPSGSGGKADVRRTDHRVHVGAPTVSSIQSGGGGAAGMIRRRLAGDGCLLPLSPAMFHQTRPSASKSGAEWDSLSTTIDREKRDLPGKWYQKPESTKPNAAKHGVRFEIETSKEEEAAISGQQESRARPGGGPGQQVARPETVEAKAVCHWLAFRTLHPGHFHDDGVWQGGFTKWNRPQTFGAETECHCNIQWILRPGSTCLEEEVESAVESIRCCP